MADFGMARPRDLTSSLPGKLDPISAVSHVTRVESEHDSLRERPPMAHPLAGRAVASPEEEAGVDVEALTRELERLNERNKDRQLRFQVNDATGELVVEVVDRRSGEVLRTMPPAAVLHLREHLADGMGLVIDSHS